MTPMVAATTLTEATRRLVEQFAPRRVILFGSQARGLAHDRSDVDFLVLMDGATGRKRSLMLAMDRALSGLNIARDIVVLTPDEYERDRHIPGTVARPASLEGIVLYDAAAS